MHRTDQGTAMQKIRILIYSNDPRDAAQPSAAYEVIAVSSGHATKLVIDDLGQHLWKQIDAMDNGSTEDQAGPRLPQVA